MNQTKFKQMPRGEIKTSYGEAVRNITAVAALIAAVAVPSAVAKPNSHNAESSFISSGFTDEFLMSGDETLANNEAQAMKAANATEAIVVLNFTNGSAEVKNTLHDLCIADEAAYNAGLKFGIRLQGFYKPKSGNSSQVKETSGFRVGYIPDHPNELKRFDAIVGSVLHGLAQDKNPDGSGGCVPENKDITLYFPNEFNSKRFSRTTLEIAAARAAKLMKYEYSRAHAEAAKPGLNVNLTVAGPEISTTPWNNPKEAIKLFAKDSGGVLYADAATFHLYATSADVANPDPGAKSTTIADTTAEFRQYFGQNIDVKMTELGGNSYTDPKDQNLYKVPASSTTFPAGKLAVFYCNSYKQAKDSGVSSVDEFHFTDNGYDVWRSGLRFPYTPSAQSKGTVSTKFKPDSTLVINTSKAASSGQQITCE